MDQAAWEGPREAKEGRAVVAKEPAGGEVRAAGDVEMEADRADDPADGAVSEAPAVAEAWAGRVAWAEAAARGALAVPGPP